jgi:spermidine synthase
MQHGVIRLLFGLSGFASLVYQVLWLKELGLLFGSTTDAAATTFTAFFLGLAAGGYVWGRSAARMRRPLRAYAVLEVCIAQ